MANPLLKIFPFFPRLLAVAVFSVTLMGCGGDSVVQENVIQLGITSTVTGFTVGDASNIQFSASGGQGKYSWFYSLSSGLSNEHFSFQSTSAVATLKYDGDVTIAGTITVTVKDQYEHQSSLIVEIQLPDDNLSLTSDKNSFAVGTSQALTFTAAGGVGSYTWSTQYSETIDKNRFFFSISGNNAYLNYDGGYTPAGTITVGLKDEMGTGLQSLIEVYWVQNALIITAKPEGLIIGNMGSIFLTTTGGKGKYTWQVQYTEGLSPDAFIFSSVDNDATLVYNGAVMSPGTAHISVRDEMGNSGDIAVNLVMPNTTIEINADSSSFTIGSPGRVKATASGGQGVYSWNFEVSEGMDKLGFTLVGTGNAASLEYDGRIMPAGLISLWTTDQLGNSGSVIIDLNESQQNLAMQTDKSSFTIGLQDVITATASGGTGAYSWTLTRTEGIDQAAFKLVDSGNEATVIYFGTIVPPGVLYLQVKDELGKSIVQRIELISPSSTLSLSFDKTAFTVGQEDTITVKASGGLGNYAWKIDYANQLVRDVFSQTTSGNTTIIYYTGGYTFSGTITVGVQDTAGATSGGVISVIGGEDRTATLEIQPEEVLVGEEALCTFRLVYQNGSKPLPGSRVVFIAEGPLYFIDQTGLSEGKTTTGTGPTDSNGYTYAKIRLETVAYTSIAGINATSDTGDTLTAYVTIKKPQ
jgi:hypothetical protein